LSEQKIPTVLIVEDDASVLRSLERLVHAGGFAVRGFATPKALLQSRIPETDVCLIVDVNLPEMDGVELRNALEATTGRAFPTILITGRSDPKTNRTIQRALAVATLYKPFLASVLFDALSTAFSRSTSKPR
jgi:two-component system response regulator FixJ